MEVFEMWSLRIQVQEWSWLQNHDSNDGNSKTDIETMESSETNETNDTKEDNKGGILFIAEQNYGCDNDKHSAK